MLIRVIEGIELSSPKIIYRLSFCHSKLAFQRIKEVEEKGSTYYKRSVKAIKSVVLPYYFLFQNFFRVINEFLFFIKRKWNCLLFLVLIF